MLLPRFESDLASLGSNLAFQSLSKDKTREINLLGKQFRLNPKQKGNFH